MDPAPLPPAIEVEVQGEKLESTTASVPFVVPIDDRLPPGADLGDALSAVPGAVVRRLGGVGAYTEVSLRGSTSRQVEIQLDGVPLDPDGASVTNLAELPLWALQEVRVWRSHPPLSAGPGGVGGVVDLVTGDPRGVSASVAGGSFGTGLGHALFAGPAGQGDALLSVDWLSTAGNFTYFSDGGTPFTALDDQVLERDNADKRQVSALARVRGGGRVAWTALDSVIVREEGVPGFTFATADAVRYAAARNLSALELTSAGPASRLTARTWAVTRTERLDDPRGEIGVGRGGAESSLTAVGLRLLGEEASRGWLRTSGVLEGRFEGWEDRARTVARGAVAANAWAGEVEFSPVLWGIVLADRATDTSTLAGYGLPRLGVAWSPDPAVRLRGSAGRTVRPPDPDELFGDRGAFVGNPDLRPEDAWHGDLGVTLEGGPLTGDASVYWREVVDLIVFVQNAQQVARPVNLNRATVRGLDLGVSGAASGIGARGAATLLEAVNRSEEPVYSGNALPRLPEFEVEASLSARRGPAQLGWQGSFTAGNWLDQANYFLAPPRTLHLVFARVALGAGWALTGEVRNVANRITAAGPRDPLVDDGALAVRAITDFTGYPLPGRTVLLGVSWVAP